VDLSQGRLRRPYLASSWYAVHGNVCLIINEKPATCGWDVIQNGLPRGLAEVVRNPAEGVKKLRIYRFNK